MAGRINKMYITYPYKPMLDIAFALDKKEGPDSSWMNLAIIVTKGELTLQ